MSDVPVSVALGPRAELRRGVLPTVLGWLGTVAGMVPPGDVCQGRARPESGALLDKLVRRIYPLSPDDKAIPITVEVIRGETVNAYATLGGRIYVFDGLLRQARSPEELAGVLAHEIEHVRERHIIQAMAVNLLTYKTLTMILPGSGPLDASSAYLFLSLQFSRQEEAEADSGGLERLRSAQVDAAGFEEFFARAQRLPAPPAILSNHPSNESRRELAARYRGYPTRPVLDPGEWAALGAICR